MQVSYSWSGDHGPIGLGGVDLVLRYDDVSDTTPGRGSVMQGISYSCACSGGELCAENGRVSRRGKYSIINKRSSQTAICWSFRDILFRKYWSAKMASSADDAERVSSLVTGICSWHGAELSARRHDDQHSVCPKTRRPTLTW